MKELFAAISALVLFALPAAQNGFRPQTYSIAFVRLKSSNLERSTAFYSTILGFPSHAHGCKNVTTPCFVVNLSQLIELIQGGPDLHGSFVDEIGFTSAGIPQMRNYFSWQNIPASEVTTGVNGLRFFEFSDPEQHRLAFVEAPPAPDESHKAPTQVSASLIHSGFVVNDRPAEDHFYHDLLGFRSYWHGGMKDSETDWLDMQVPNGTDWIEYMLNVPPNADSQTLGVMNHIALGVPDIHAAYRQLAANGWKPAEEPQIGRDGKWQLNLYDPDGTRVEFMEFTPKEKPCCSPYTGPHPGEQSPAQARSPR
jgi:catechol 2,3-dioxygenase-like lactoylglutathione lyase family enzyme